MLEHELGVVTPQVVDHARSVSGGFVRMQPRYEGFGIGRRVIFGDADQLAEARGEIGPVGIDVPVPQSVVCAAHGQRIALLAGLEPLGSLLQLGDPLLQGGGHDVEMLGEPRQLVAAIVRQAMIEVAVRNGLAAGEQAGQLVAEQVADARQQYEGNDDFNQRDQGALLDDRLSRLRQHRYRHAELKEADLVAGKQERAPHVNHGMVEHLADSDARGRSRRWQAAHAGLSGAQQYPAGGVADADVDQPLVRVCQQFAERVLQGAVARLFAVRCCHRVQHARVLTDQRVETGGGGVVHQAHAVCQQQAQQDDLHRGACKEQPGAYRTVAERHAH